MDNSVFLSEQDAEKAGLKLASGEPDRVLRDFVRRWNPAFGGKVVRAQFLVGHGDLGQSMDDDVIEVGLITDHGRRGRIWSKGYISIDILRATQDNNITFRYLKTMFDDFIEDVARRHIGFLSESTTAPASETASASETP